jgi:hypothetical protein
MPGYIARGLQRFVQPMPERPEHAPHDYAAPTYGSHQQFATIDPSPAVNSEDTKRIQEVLGTLLYYACAVDCTMIPAIGTITTEQANATTATMKAITKLLNHCATHPDAVVRYYSSDMILWIESDASHLSGTKARSCAAGYHYLSNKPPNPNQPPAPTDPSPPMNGATVVPCKVMREVLSSASEAELAALFYNGKEGAPLRITLEELGHKQPPTPMVTDNSSMASGITNDPKLWICDSIGFETASGKTSTMSIGGAALLTAPIISQSIILPNIMSPCALLIFWSPTKTTTMMLGR